MWLRDSANQLQSYVSLLKPLQTTSSSSSSSGSSGTTTPNRSNNKLASLFRGAINLQARYLLASPHCNAFQPPAEAEMAPGNDGNKHDLVFPHYDPAVVFECKYELDSLAAFLQLSWDYYSHTKDARFFLDASAAPPRGAGTTTTTTTQTQQKSASDIDAAAAGATSRRAKRSGSRNSSLKEVKRRRRARRASDGWRDAVVAVLDAAEGMRVGTYTPEGMVPGSPYRFERTSSIPTETLGNRGNGHPVRAGTGLVRSAFRPSDDATTFQLLVPANMMFARYLERCAEIMAKVEKEEARLAALAEAQGVAQDLEEDEEAAAAGEEEELEVEGDGEAVAERMRRMAKEIKKGIEKYGKIKHPEFGEIYAYEIDGYWSSNAMVSRENARALCMMHTRRKTDNAIPSRTTPTSPPSSPPR